MRKEVVLIIIGILIGIILVVGALPTVLPIGIAGTSDIILSVNNDAPAPVTIRIFGFDKKENLLWSVANTWTQGDNLYSTKTITVPKETRMLRLRFENDFVNETVNRDALIDRFVINGVIYQAENFDRTGSTDINSTGCTIAEEFSRTVAACRKNGDYVEYDLHPGNPVAWGGKGEGPKT